MSLVRSKHYWRKDLREHASHVVLRLRSLQSATTLMKLLLVILVSLFTATGYAEDWPQFRGPNGRAVSETATPPVRFGPASNLLWKVATPPGFSSPIVAGQRIFLTAATNGQFQVLCLDRRDGRLLWRKQVARERTKPATDERLATPTPVTDGKSVYVLFGLLGLMAYDVDGDEQWRRPIEASDEETTASPILIDDKLIAVFDNDHDSFVEACDKKSGRLIWRSERARFHQSRSTPFHWVNTKRDELIVPGSLWLTSYDPLTGHENWHYSGTSVMALSSPAAGESLLFYASAQGGSQESTVNTAEPSSPPSLDDLGSLEPDAPKPEKGVLAINSCGSGDITSSHLAWKGTRGLPNYSSPLLYKRRLFTIKSGGLISAYHAKDGSPVYQEERINAPGEYYASAVAAAGRVYLTSENGTVTVIDAEKDVPTVLAQNKIGEKVMATPALIEGSIMIRTEMTFYCFAATN
jgi:outer membrane protein assembly factor BamB